MTLDRGCSTADCEGMPMRMVRLYDLPGEGPWPYCVECATLLARGGDEDCGPFDPVTDEMVERAALALFAHEEARDKHVECGMLAAREWDSLPTGCYVHASALERARVVLAAAMTSHQRKDTA